MRELQTFTLMDGEDAYAISGITLYGLTANVFVPFAQESVDVAGVILHKHVQLVVERTDIGTLLVQTLQLEDAIEPFNQLIERQMA